jgi:hypothetical protein
MPDLAQAEEPIGCSTGFVQSVEHMPSASVRKNVNEDGDQQVHERKRWYEVNEGPCESGRS